MLSCSLPCEISSELDKLDITYSSSKGADNFDDSDEEILSDLEIDCEDGDGNYDSKRGNRRRGKGGGGRHSGKGDDYQEEDDNFFPKSNEEATRWLRQSKNDLDGAKWLLQSGPPFSAHACFHCHQVVEKCLKAMLFNRCGVSGGLLASHEIGNLANHLREKTGLLDEMIMESVRRLANYYLNTRYPNRQPRNIVPFEAFSKNQAEAALEAASNIYELVSKHWLRK
ncbi:uncharacterized protein LOC114523631 [Dendronephthya gigantea]|uniref:uncharacterized protein LOC114523631 n=1 Tax=Dendronephthya gigantea TaxID=151771 RepID=UPI00106D6107|nr:uncharacterized protein LOC114523631 [Dendronephthya gigantea]